MEKKIIYAGYPRVMKLWELSLFMMVAFAFSFCYCEKVLKAASK
jgi:hypothetical protein